MTSTASWVLLRGLTRESGHWGSFPDQLCTRLPGGQVIALDLPGNGALHRGRSPASVAGMVEATRRQLAERQVAPPYHLLALSLGAMVALDWAAHRPQELAGCVLLNTSLARLSPFYRRLRPANYAALAGLLAGRGGAAVREHTILHLTSARPEAHPAAAAEWAAIRQARPVSPGNALRQLLAALRHRAPRVAPLVPMLVVAGAGDRLVDPRCSQALARAWGLPIVLHPWAGHDLTLDDGPWVAEQVARWLAGQRTADCGNASPAPTGPSESTAG